MPPLSLTGRLTRGLSRPLSRGLSRSSASASTGIPVTDGLVKLYDAAVPSSIDGSLNWTSQATPSEVATANGTLKPMDYVQARSSMLYEAQTGDYHNVPNPRLTLPMTVIVAFTPNPGKLSDFSYPFSVSNNTSANNWHALGLNGGNFVVHSRNGNSPNDIVVIAAAASGLHVLVGEWSASNARRGRVDNGSWVSSVVTVNPTGLAVNSLGTNWSGATQNSPFNGEIHRVAVYDRVLTDLEHTQVYNWMQITFGPFAQQILRDFPSWNAIRDLNNDPIVA